MIIGIVQLTWHEYNDYSSSPEHIKPTTYPPFQARITQIPRIHPPMDSLTATDTPSALRQLPEPYTLTEVEVDVFLELWKETANRIPRKMSKAMTEKAKENDLMDKKKDCYSRKRMKKAIEARREDEKREAEEKKKREDEAGKS
ncbi:hypothetical protein EAE96_009034 [Botrytis aclada]|nr:hypothetical protein EAE96_009034 [Botrytis aclada]